VASKALEATCVQVVTLGLHSGGRLNRLNPQIVNAWATDTFCTAAFSSSYFPSTPCHTRNRTSGCSAAEPLETRRFSAHSSGKWSACDYIEKEPTMAWKVAFAAQRRSMKVHLINPSDTAFGTAVITPRWLFVLAASTPPEFGDPILWDETVRHVDLNSVKPGGVVGIGIHTGNALRGYSVGRSLKERGAFVIFGGIHATLYPDEPFEHGRADCVVRGEVTWPGDTLSKTNGKVNLSAFTRAGGSKETNSKPPAGTC
jgi:hypothetical protein